MGLRLPAAAAAIWAVADLAQCLSERLGCFDIQGEDVTMLPAHQRSLFADLGPLG